MKSRLLWTTRETDGQWRGVAAWTWTSETTSAGECSAADKAAMLAGVVWLVQQHERLVAGADDS